MAMSDGGPPGKERRALQWFVVMVAMVVMVRLALLHWHLVDDAFIAFRFVANAHDGHGYVWNAPPFLPVEGYTSFLWVALLDAVWRMTGIEPPQAANGLSLAAMMGALAIVARRLVRITDDLPRGLGLATLAASMALVVTHRTVLVSASSGLETGLWVLLVTAWVDALLDRRAGLLCAMAGLLPLARPEGMLLWLLSLVWVVMARDRIVSRRWVVTPLALPLVHLGWRRWFYGEWLANTYYAKVTRPWPSMGLRYLASFVVEYGLAVLLVAALVALWRCRRSASREALVVAIAAAVQLGFYVVMAGGDLFEYRPFAPWVVWTPLALIAALPQRLARGWWAPGLLLAQAAVSAVLPWTAWHRSTALGQSLPMDVALAPAVPWVLRPWATAHDGLQRTLHTHYVGTRSEYQGQMTRWLEGSLPARGEGPRSRADGHVVLAANAVGVVGWRLPGCDVIDFHGLSDWVIARTPPAPGRVRRVAHEHTPPAGYLRDFALALDWVPGQGLRPRPQGRLLRDEEVRAIEARWRARVREGQLPPALVERP